MGWWSEDILGGDEALDAVGRLEGAVGWKWDAKTGAGIESPKSTDAARVVLTSPANVKAIEKLIATEAAKSKDDSAVAVLSIVYVLILQGVPISREIEAEARKAILNDPWGSEGDKKRLEALDDFRIRLNAAVGARPSDELTFKVRVSEEVEFQTELTIKAKSQKEAREIAEGLAKRHRTTKAGWTRQGARVRVCAITAVTR